MIPTDSPPAVAIPPASTASRVAQRLGRRWVDAIVGGDFDRLVALLAPDVHVRAIVPAEYREESTAAGARALVEDWFGETDERDLLRSTIDVVGDRLVVGYRLGLITSGERRIVEQHMAATVDGGRFRDVALLCTGFRPLVLGHRSPNEGRAANASAADGHTVEARPLVPGGRLDATGLSCATLTPAIRSAVLALEPGAILEIVSDDPAAEEGLRSWTRLTGHELVSAEAGPGAVRRFHIRRSQQSATRAARKGTN
jgi:TusA-related sulfurtransferase